MNLTDGLDGLAISVRHCHERVLALAYVTGHRVFANTCSCAFRRRPATVFCGSWSARRRFLWYAHAAEIFMGDVGSWRSAPRWGSSRSRSNGAAAPIVGGVFVLEVVSVAQVGYFKATGGQRIFRMPLPPS